VVSVDRTPFIDVAERVPEIIAAAWARETPRTTAVDTITALRPFLRWEPVQPPAVVARHGNSPGSPFSSSSSARA
jgi:hypothetical protein